MYELIADEKNKKTILKISGDMTVMNISELYKELTVLAAGDNDVEMELHDLGDVDMTFYQLICSAHRTFMLKGRLFSLSGDKRAIFDNKEYNGYNRHKGCARDKLGNCVLVKEK